MWTFVKLKSSEKRFFALDGDPTRDHQGPVARSKISANPGLPDNLLFWIRLFRSDPKD